MSAIYKLPLVLDPQPEGGFTVTCPALPELITEGDTAEQAIENVSDALSALLEAYEYLHLPVPKILERAAVDHPLKFETLITVP